MRCLFTHFIGFNKELKCSSFWGYSKVTFSTRLIESEHDLHIFPKSLRFPNLNNSVSIAIFCVKIKMPQERKNERKNSVSTIHFGVNKTYNFLTLVCLWRPPYLPPPFWTSPTMNSSQFLCGTWTDNWNSAVYPGMRLFAWNRGGAPWRIVGTPLRVGSKESNRRTSWKRRKHKSGGIWR